ncbi:N-acetyl-gamma-glutamyl-phosphate reductase [Occallatibacter savannae]|uniref:N-acetyl-gamma-glutamyl-phosphate reductase n=1 Tax=Occallatibacter savannae TaxID=1002691 RepID=UPI000D69A666|nr:N-acetyl-gamma-glutamyl-phosphate reductase [Occallatibacter savannae]
MSHAVQTAVIGVTGYAGAELARLLLHHPRLKGTPPVFAGRVNEKDAARGGVPLEEIHPQLADNNGSRSLKMQPFSWKAMADRGVEVLFLATPHEQSREWVPEALEHGLRVVDLSGAWRLTEAKNRAVYAFEDEGAATATATQAQAVYGMPELHRAEIAEAKLVANPGCYATSVILAVRPLVAAGLLDLAHGIVADSKSGVSGAGKAPTAKTHYMYAADNLSAYGVFSHRHTGELLEQIGIAAGDIVFTPHLLPIPRGIMSTIYVRFKEPQTRDIVLQVYRDFFAASPMVRIYENSLPQIQYSVRTNFADIGFQLSNDGRRAVIVSCLDNLLKGASGQAVQNMNVMLGWNEAEGLA